ncbi:MAG: hypothetical protein KAQ63_01180 [Candidatus Moranbacteria bacterium]|nr:hypothetical protein [Candidatus Moranbacteria bacterium]
MAKKFVPLFPQYLDKESSGAAPDFLARVLTLRGFMEKESFESGSFPTNGVKMLQATLDFDATEIDGNFGPKTRIADFTQNRFRWNIVPNDTGKITFWYGPNHQGAKQWPKP